MSLVSRSGGAAVAALAKPLTEEERELQFDLALCGSSFIFSTISNTIVTFAVRQRRTENNVTKARHYQAGQTLEATRDAS